MGEYTSLFQRLEEPRPQKEGVGNSTNVNINDIHKNIEGGIDKPIVGQPEPMLQGFSSVDMPQGVASGGKGEAERRAKSATPLRPYAVNAVVRCIHDNAPDACAVCSGYVRWLSAGGDGRVAEAQRDPEAARRAFWRSMKGAG